VVPFIGLDPRELLGDSECVDLGECLGAALLLLPAVAVEAAVAVLLVSIGGNPFICATRRAAAAAGLTGMRANWP
jgi:hypothetical protein